jgi:hypothetical protein
MTVAALKQVQDDLTASAVLPLTASAVSPLRFFWVMLNLFQHLFLHQQILKQVQDDRRGPMNIAGLILFSMTVADQLGLTKITNSQAWCKIGLWRERRRSSSRLESS